MDDKVLKALCEKRRFELLQLMSRRSYCVRALALAAHMSEPAISQHIKILREAGLVYGIKRGFYTHYEVDKEALRQVIGEFEAICSAQRKPCDAPFYGCPESQQIRCQAYVPSELRQKETE